jgi:hypothetical protein
MNERIKELAEQAGMYDFVLEAMGIGEEFEKFAELIVRECMDVVAKKCASPTAYNALAEHWGVEE